ncbi:hypothetical protein FHS15_001461 [Paenibacillus castaneae]|uniref:YwmB family TATA-box binding protein n=1 Tax=Paenibacillus castaneae TaxID=474957 RepID=UPI000C9B5AB8|nr:YwmB family TATA-box binding protein [Paenibacillus castaneae]NIK76354.1 hypothetical protein [Paenibacillus castaneae]
MYFPKETTFVPKRPFVKQNSKKPKAGIVVALLVILIGAAAALWQADKKTEEEAIAEQMLNHDLQVLWETSDVQLKSGSIGADWTIRWNVKGDKGAMNALVKKLFIDEKGKDIEKIVQNDGKTVSGVDDAFGGRISISLIGNDYESEQLMLLLETNPALLLDKIRLLQAAESISKEVVRISPDFTSSMKVQGYTENKLAAEQIKKQVNAKQIDRFEDGGIMSEMLFTGMLRSTIDVGGGKSANLQIAVHQERNSDQIALTIGVPIITGDYSAVARDELK